MPKKPVILTILDGFGYSEQKEHNAIHLAKTPFLDKLWDTFPRTLINCSGESVGLPEGQIGNSEVGHIHIGSGRTTLQSLQKINKCIDQQNLNSIDIFNNICNSKKRIHLIGLLSDGGVHSHIEHFKNFIKQLSLTNPNIIIHAFLDGRDTPPRSADSAISAINSILPNAATIASICGRYYAMDRDNNWERTKLAYDMLHGTAEFQAKNAVEALQQGYERGESDEFIKPTICADNKFFIKNDDIIIFLNFRADRARQLSQAFIEHNFTHFPTRKTKLYDFITMTEYDKNYPCSVLFPPTNIKNTLGELISKANLRQLRIAETEKYAHVTYFFNGGIEKKFNGEDRILIPSPKVATYDQKPEMSAELVTQKLLEKMHEYDFIVCNFANADMVGHTGNLTATIKAIEVLDQSLEKIHNHLNQLEGWMLITADHGNAENMYNNSSEQPHTAHTNNLVPCILTSKSMTVTQQAHGYLTDIAPTILNLMQIPIPEEITGTPLFSVK
ncbi:MAG: 2,3-bisphosphoglycerate-independent phosphoglycerate mutase [Legionellales bacterium]|nr:2,3-bisphosphoglycerate-independent phosphoglycerate mutase [Legionellales bacterium]